MRKWKRYGLSYHPASSRIHPSTTRTHQISKLPGFLTKNSCTPPLSTLWLTFQARKSQTPLLAMSPHDHNAPQFSQLSGECFIDRIFYITLALLKGIEISSRNISISLLIFWGCFTVRTHVTHYHELIWPRVRWLVGPTLHFFLPQGSHKTV